MGDLEENDVERVAELFELSLDAPHLVQALTHPSFANERDGVLDNQRLEFMGDSVLGFCVAQLLYERFPDCSEGVLTRQRAQLVNADALADYGRSIRLAPALRLGRGAISSGLQDSTNVLADAVEALLAATYLDAGLAASRRVCGSIVAAGLLRLDQSSGRDPKSELQELSQATGGTAPIYRVVDSGGPDHARWFEVEVCHNGRSLGVGRGRSKRLAERAAASEALAADERQQESGQDAGS